MPRALPNSHKDVRKSVVHLLKNGRLFGRLFSADVIANLLNTAAEVNIDAEPRFTEDIVTAAFSTGYETSAIPLANFGIEHTNAMLYLMAGEEQAVDLFNKETWGDIGQGSIYFTYYFKYT